MASKTIQTYFQKGMREDLANQISDLFADDVPFFAMAQKIKAESTKHEWIADALESTSRTAVKEGWSVVYAQPTARVRYYNYTTIRLRNWDVSFTQAAMNSAGIKDEVARNVMKAMKSLIRDFDSIFLWSANTAVGASGTARVCGGLFRWAGKVGGSAGSLPTAKGTGTGSTGRQIIQEDKVNTVMQRIWNLGGDPRALFCGGMQKRSIAKNFTAKTGFSWNIEASTRTAIANINKYEGSFGTVDIIPDRNMMVSRAAVVSPDMVKVAILRDIESYKGAPTHSSIKGWVEAEMTLNFGHPQAHGQLAWLRTSGTV